MKTIDLEDVKTNNTISRKIEVKNGISHENREEIVNGLSNVLADSYMLMLKTLNYHWNVRGSMFHSIHLMTEEQYNEMLGAVDKIAERIRALGFLSPGTVEAFSESSKIKSGVNTKTQEDMVAELVADHEHLSIHCRNVLRIADEYGDEGTVDLLTGRLNKHAKYAWMLRSLLEK